MTRFWFSFFMATLQYFWFWSQIVLDIFWNFSTLHSYVKKRAWSKASSRIDCQQTCVCVAIFYKEPITKWSVPFVEGEKKNINNRGVGVSYRPWCRSWRTFGGIVKRMRWTGSPGRWPVRPWHLSRHKRRYANISVNIFPICPKK